MADGNWQKAKEIFLAALEVPPDERAQFLADRCKSDGSLIEEVRSLLDSHDELEDFIETPAFSVPSLVADASALIGKDLGNYRIASEIGHGGMGSVFLGERIDGEYRHQVAIKVVRPGLDTADVRRRFLHERQILAGLEHPYIARLIDGGTTPDGLPFLVMEYVQGEPITEYSKTLSLNDRLRLFQKVCEAVAYAHRSLVIHRDLKPSNIFVTADGQPKLLDFGIAKLLDDTGGGDGTLTNFGAFTPDYASPEQIRGGQITTASDVYSLGVILYEMLAGTSPYRFETRSPDELVRIICEESPSSPSRLLSAGAVDPMVKPGELAGDLENIVLLALRKEPERRYSSVEQFAGDIQRYLDGLPVMAGEDTLPYRTSKFIRRHRYGVAMTAALALILIAGIMATAWQARAARQQRDAAEAERAKAETINKFLQEMLSYSSQSWRSEVATGQRRDVTINEMLDEIAPRLESELADQPEVRAQMYQTIASAYHSQGRFPLAEKYFRDALAIQYEIYGDSHPETLATLGDLGAALFQLARTDEARDIFAGLVDKYRARLASVSTPDEKYRFAAALHGLGSVLTVQNDPERAIPIMRDAVNTLASIELLDNKRGLVAEVKLNFAAALMARDDLVESEALLRDSLAIFRSVPGSPRWEMGVTLSKLGECLTRKGDYEEAIALLREGEDVYRNTIGEANNFLTRNLNTQGIAALARGDMREAEGLSRRSVEILDRAGKPPGPVRAQSYMTLGTALCRTGRSAKGISLLTQSVEIFRNAAAPETAEAEVALRACAK